MKVIALLIQTPAIDSSIGVTIGAMENLFPGSADIYPDTPSVLRPVLGNQQALFQQLLAEGKCLGMAWLNMAAVEKMGQIPLDKDADSPVLRPEQEELNASLAAKSLRQVEREYLERVLAENNGNKSLAAKSLRIHRRTLQRKLLRLSCSC